MNKTAFEPRIGLAYKLFGSDKTAIRAGYAVYHDSAWSMGAQGLWQNPPFFAESDGFNPSGCAFKTSYCSAVLGQSPNAGSMDAGFPIFAGPPTLSTFSGTLFTQPTDFHLGMVQQFNVNVERQLPGNVIATAGYAGSRGRHLLVAGNNLNTFGPSSCVAGRTETIGCNPDGSAFIPPYAAANSMLLFGDIGRTQYDSLQLKLETKTPKHGLYALVSYTYSRTYDNGLSDGLGSLLSAPYFPLPNWQNLDWGLSQINLDNSFTGSVIYDLPFGRGKQFGSSWNSLTNAVLGNFQVTLIERISSGFPDTLIDSINNSGAAFSNGGNAYNWNRPDRVAGCNAGNVAHAKLQWINSDCFVAPAAGELGNASRAPATGPDFVNTDFSVIKQIGLPREMGLNFRAEFFNLFNRSQFGLPVNDVSSPGFGFVQSTVNNAR